MSDTNEQPEESKDEGAEQSEAQLTTGDAGDEETETTYESLPTGQRITRRKVRKRETVEDIDETVTEDVALVAYQAPMPSHPAPVG